MSSFKQKLTLDIKNFIKETKWEEIAGEQISDVLELRPYSAFIYLHQKNTAKFKLDSSKSNNIVFDIGFYCSYCDPFIISSETFSNKIISVCIEKYQQQKIRRGDLLKITSIILLDFENSEKDFFIKQIFNRVTESVPIIQFSSIVYHTTVYKNIIREINDLQQQMEYTDEKLTHGLFLNYLSNMNDRNSYIKMMKIEQIFKDQFSEDQILNDIGEFLLKLIFE